MSPVAIKYMGIIDHDTGSESPSTPTDKSGAKLSSQLVAAMALPPLIVLQEESPIGYGMKVASLPRSAKLRTANSQDKDSSDSCSDMNTADEASTGPKSTSRWMARHLRTGPCTNKLVSRVTSSFRFLQSRYVGDTINIKVAT